MKQFFSRILFSAAALAGISGSAQAGTFTDMWWNAGESGWGMNVVQQDETAVITLFTYDANRQPVWYFASTAPVTAYTAAGLPIFAAELYRTRGPWEGGVFNPAQVAPARVGTLSLEPLDKERLRLSYSVNGLVVNKQVTRMSFASHFVAANYLGSFNLRQTLPGRGPIGTLQASADVLLHIDGTQAYMSTHGSGGHCEYLGAYRQAGKLGKFSGNFNCNSGRNGTFAVSDLEITIHGVSGQLTTASAELQETGRFAAARV